ncbi:MAG: Gfo/Idh/MocA family oxidoreductase [Oscillospiraceae bacterium]|jgi:predicted dehydrogenase|nr:Gfo/Idh/MocA family oxidoreductase [Oscillospiraceae bacterium]
MDTVKLGIIGVGNMGTSHCKNILEGLIPGLELAAVADRSAARRAWIGENFPETVRVFEEGTELIESGCCDAVLISVPHYDHPGLSMLAFERGQHVLCEKPAGVYALQVREMNAAAAQHPELTFAMMFNQRTNCVYRKMKELLASGEMGAITRVNWLITDWFRTQYYYDSGAWRATWGGEGGGVLLNQCPHNLDLLQWLAGMPSRVTAFCQEGKWHDIEVEDDVTAYLEYPNGATGVFITTTGNTPGTNRLEIDCDGGKLVCENNILTLHKNEIGEAEFRATSRESFAKPSVTVTTVETDGENPQHIGVLKAFAAHILRGEPLVAGGEEGIHGLLLSNAMHLSSWLGRPVDLPIDDALFLDELNKRRATSRLKTGESVVSDTEGSYGSK